MSKKQRLLLTAVGKAERLAQVLELLAQAQEIQAEAAAKLQAGAGFDRQVAEMLAENAADCQQRATMLLSARALRELAEALRQSLREAVMIQPQNGKVD